MAPLMLPAQEAWRIWRSSIHWSAWKVNSPKFAVAEKFVMEILGLTDVG
jgi:hypothetical protein